MPRRRLSIVGILLFVAAYIGSIVLYIDSGVGHPHLIRDSAASKDATAITIVIAEEGDDTVRPYADHLIEIPSVSTLLQPLLSTIPLQVFAASVAQARGYDVDKPRNLAKSVTVE